MNSAECARVEINVISVLREGAAGGEGEKEKKKMKKEDKLFRSNNSSGLVTKRYTYSFDIRFNDN